MKIRNQEEVELIVRTTIAEVIEVDVEEVELNSSLYADLGVESLDLLDMSYRVEQEFQIVLPRIDPLYIASGFWEKEDLMKDGLITDLGISLLRKSMPELDPNLLKPGLKVYEVHRLFTPASIVRVILRLLEVKSQIPQECTDCNVPNESAKGTPDLHCPNCEKVYPMPLATDILMEDIKALMS